MAAMVDRGSASSGITAPRRWGNAPPMVAVGMDLSHLRPRPMEVLNVEDLERERKGVADQDTAQAEAQMWGLSGALETCLAPDCSTGVDEVNPDDPLVTRTFYWRPEDFPLEVATYMQTEQPWNSRAALHARAQAYGYRKMGLMQGRVLPTRVEQRKPDQVPVDMMDCEVVFREGLPVGSDVPGVRANERRSDGAEALHWLSQVDAPDCMALPASKIPAIPAPGVAMSFRSVTTQSIAEPSLLDLNGSGEEAAAQPVTTTAPSASGSQRVTESPSSQVAPHFELVVRTSALEEKLPDIEAVAEETSPGTMPKLSRPLPMLGYWDGRPQNAANALLGAPLQMQPPSTNARVQSRSANHTMGGVMAVRGDVSETEWTVDWSVFERKVPSVAARADGR